MRTEWGVMLGVKRIPAPEFISYPSGVYGWKIDKHGIFALGDSAEKCRSEFTRAYFSETGVQL